MPKTSKTNSRKRKQEQTLLQDVEVTSGSSSHPAQSSIAAGKSPKQTSSREENDDELQNSEAQTSSAAGKSPTHSSSSPEKSDENFLLESHPDAQTSTSKGEIPLATSAEELLSGASQSVSRKANQVGNDESLFRYGTRQQSLRSQGEIESFTIQSSVHSSLNDEERSVSAEESEDEGTTPVRFLSIPEFENLPVDVFGPAEEEDLTEEEKRNRGIFESILSSVSRLHMLKGRGLKDLVEVRRFQKHAELVGANASACHHDTSCKYACEDNPHARVQTRTVVRMIAFGGSNPFTAAAVEVVSEVIYAFAKQEKFFQKDDCCEDIFLSAEAASALAELAEYAREVLPSKYKRRLWQSMRISLRNYLPPFWESIFNTQETLEERNKRLHEKDLEDREQAIRDKNREIKDKEKLLLRHANQLIEKIIPRDLAGLEQHPDDAPVYDRRGKLTTFKKLRSRIGKDVEGFLYRQENRQ